MSLVVRLVVPGHATNMHAKALDAGADEVVFDLEDAVAPAARCPTSRLPSRGIAGGWSRRGSDLLMRRAGRAPRGRPWGSGR
jgi:hypothetical protein